MEDLSLEELLVLRIDRDKRAELVARCMVEYYSLMDKALEEHGVIGLARAKGVWQDIYMGYELFVDDEFGVDYIALFRATKYLSTRFEEVVMGVGYERNG